MKRLPRIVSAEPVIHGVLKIVCEKDGQRWETVLRDRDLISVPPGVYREEINVGDEDALMCVMLGAAKPILPAYPPGSPLAELKKKREQAAALE